jgi:hypothetical protein
LAPAGKSGALAVPDAQDVQVFAADLVANDIGVDQRPFAQAAGDGATAMREVAQIFARLDQRSCEAGGGGGVELGDIGADVAQVGDRRG